jgi:hypothetical protein
LRAWDGRNWGLAVTRGGQDLLATPARAAAAP